MAVSLVKTSNLNVNLNKISYIYNTVRNGHHMRGKPPGIAKSLEQKLKERSYKDPSIYFRIDIGFPPANISRFKELKKRLENLKARRKNSTLEILAREKKLLIDLDKVKEVSQDTAGPYYVKQIADHYGVYQHLFGDAYFYPRVPLTITYSLENGDLPVYYGNVIKASDAKEKPQVNYISDTNSLWTLILTNPDGHFTEENSEYIHWFIGNIPGNDITKGETLVEYLQPFPPKGTGYHRHIFILYKQEKRIDFSKFKRDGLCLNLSDRTFLTYDFYKNHQDDLTPAGLAFFQSDWDKSLKHFYHNILCIKEPIFEYDFPPPYIRKQEWFPLRKPFNLYMDKYRDPKQINKEFLMRKLQKVHPFREPSPPYPYPNAQYFMGYNPSWLKLEKMKSRLRWGRINDIE